MSSRWTGLAVVLVLLGCGHSDAFTPVLPTVGPFSTGDDVRLTFNGDQDYWPTWTGDGRGILYAFVNPAAPGIPAGRHRCLGILPAAGGTRIWQWCDDRATEADSTTSFTAYALGTDGRLLYVEAVAPANSASFPRQVTLWLADTAAPLNRTALLTVPAALAGVTWLADLAWTGPNSFIALGQVFASFPHCSTCFSSDSLFADSSQIGGLRTASGIVVIGTITGGQATLHAVSGTEGAAGYSLAQNGASIAFIHRDDQRLYKVPLAGGVPVMIATAAAPGQELLGVSCRGSMCVVADDAVAPSYGGGETPIYAQVLSGPKELVAVSLADGTVQVLRSFSVSPATPVISVPQIAPGAGDVVVQIGGTFGHLQTNTGVGNSDLHLYPALVP